MVQKVRYGSSKLCYSHLLKFKFHKKIGSKLRIHLESNSSILVKYLKESKKKRIASVTDTAKRYVNKIFDHNLLSKYLLRKAYEKELVNNITSSRSCFNNLYTTFLNFRMCHGQIYSDLR